jgi:hypothetical protein
MMWMWLSAVVVLVGAKLNAEIEHQTSIDSTVGPPKPLGTRGAVAHPSRFAPIGRLASMFFIFDVLTTNVAGTGFRPRQKRY